MSGGRPAGGARVWLEPGGHATEADSAGFFRLSRVPRGRYLLRAAWHDLIAASDSITNSEFGVELLVSLARPDPDLLECVRGGR